MSCEPEAKRRGGETVGQSHVGKSIRSVIHPFSYHPNACHSSKVTLSGIQPNGTETTSTEVHCGISTMRKYRFGREVSLNFLALVWWLVVRRVPGRACTSESNTRRRLNRPLLWLVLADIKLCNCQPHSLLSLYYHYCYVMQNKAFQYPLLNRPFSRTVQSNIENCPTWLIHRLGNREVGSHWVGSRRIRSIGLGWIGSERSV